VQVIVDPRQSNSAAQTPDVLLVDAAGAARILGISRRHVEDLHRERRLPPPIRLGRSVRFSVESLRQFVEAEARKAAEAVANRSGEVRE
jgi:excisionase family DNA binding protein